MATIDLRKGRQALAVATEGGFSKAAKVLNVSQPALTKSVQALEAQLGVSLFERGPNGAHLTEEGRWFMDRIALILRDADELADAARALTRLEAGRLRIGVGPAAIDAVLARALPTFAAAYPEIRVEIIGEPVSEIGRLLISGAVDFALGNLTTLGEDVSLQVETLGSHAVEFFVRTKHPLALMEPPPSVNDVLMYPLIAPRPVQTLASAIQTMSRNAGSRFAQPHLVVDSFGLTQRMVETTDSVGIVFSTYAGSSLFKQRFKVLSGLWSFPFTLDFAHRRAWRPSRSAEAFLDILRSAY